MKPLAGVLSLILATLSFLGADASPRWPSAPAGGGVYDYPSASTALARHLPAFREPGFATADQEGGVSVWPRDSYTGPGGGLYTGPGGGLYTGPGGGASTGPGGGLSTGPGGGMYAGPGGGLYTGPGGGLYTGPGGGLYTGPGGGLYTGPGGGLYTGPGGGLYTGPSSQPYRSNWPTRGALIEALRDRGLDDVARTLKEAWGM